MDTPLIRITPHELVHHKIGDTGITVAALLDVFIRTQDGRLDREMRDEYGPLGDRVARVRAKVMPAWTEISTR